MVVHTVDRYAQWSVWKPSAGIGGWVADECDCARPRQGVRLRPYRA